MEDLLDCDYLGLVFADQVHEPVEDDCQAMRQTIALGKVNRPVANGIEFARSILIDDAIPRPFRAAIDSQDAHRGGSDLISKWLARNAFQWR
jgi:hypothetical protein